jgi:acyl carrier protein
MPVADKYPPKPCKETAMSAATFIDHFIQATDFREPVSISLDTALSALPEWDSLAALGVIVMFDLEYQRAITGDQLHQALTVGDLFKLVN